MLTSQQLPALKAAILAETDPAFVEYRTNGQNTLMAAFYNAASTFVVYKSSETVASVGQAVNYIAFEALTTANLLTAAAVALIGSGAFPLVIEKLRENEGG